MEIILTGMHTGRSYPTDIPKPPWRRHLIEVYAENSFQGGYEKLIGKHTGSGISEDLGNKLTSRIAYFCFLTQPKISLERSICYGHLRTISL